MANAMTVALKAMSNSFILEYKGFALPANPATIEISNGRKVSIKSSHGNNPVTQDLGASPTEIKGSGTFYCDDAEEKCQQLAHLIRKDSSGWLICPYAVPIKAYLTRFDYKISSNKKSISYDFTFVEDCNTAKTVRLFEYTQALAGDNAFIIANREGVSVTDIMALNDYKTPYDIKEEDMVKIR